MRRYALSAVSYKLFTDSDFIANMRQLCYEYHIFGETEKKATKSPESPGFYGSCSDVNSLTSFFFFCN